MKNKTILFTRFNRLHSDDPSDWRFKKTLGNKEWWRKRRVLMEKYFLPSVNAQTNQKFDRWAVFTQKVMDIDAGLTSEVLITIELLKKHSFSICWEYEPNDSRLDEPYQAVIASVQSGINPDFWTLLNVDNDDMIADDVVEIINRTEKKPGLVFVFQDGFIIDDESQKLATYLAKGSPPNFNAMVYGRDATINKEAWFKFKETYNMELRHYQLDKAKFKFNMPPMSYCHVNHSANTSMGLENPDVKKHLGVIIEDDRLKEYFLSWFNYGADNKNNQN